MLIRRSTARYIIRAIGTDRAKGPCTRERSIAKPHSVSRPDMNAFPVEAIVSGTLNRKPVAGRMEKSNMVQKGGKRHGACLGGVKP